MMLKEIFEVAEEDKPYNFEYDLVVPLRKAFKFCYNMQRKNRHKNVPWGGPDKGGACFPRPSEALTSEQLEYSEDDQGRDALDELIAVALQVGIEQGRRIAMSGDIVKGLKLDILLAKLKLENK